MKEQGIKAIWVRSYVRTTIGPDFDDKLKNILQKDFNPRKPNTDWVTDITYIHTLSESVYLTSVMDLFSRKIIGRHLSDRLSTKGVLQAIKKARINRRLTHTVIIHSDRGCQYISKSYIDQIPAKQFIRSYLNKANLWDNAYIESFILIN